jgi:hypothetical protein
VPQLDHGRYAGVVDGCNEPLGRDDTAHTRDEQHGRILRLVFKALARARGGGHEDARV